MMDSAQPQSLRDKIAYSWKYGSLHRTRYRFIRQKHTYTSYFRTCRTAALIILAAAIAAFIFGLHKGGSITQIIAFLIFLPVYARFLISLRDHLSIRLFRDQSPLMHTVVIGLLVWVGLDILGYVIVPSIAVERIIGFEPFGPVYRLIEAFTGVYPSQIGLPFWRSL